MMTGRTLAAFIVSAFLALTWIPVALAQNGSGQFTAGQILGNAGAFQAPPSAQLLSPILDRNFGAPSAQGTILNRGASAWGATATPILGIPGSATGSLGYAGSSGGTVTVQALDATGTWTFKWPTSAGSPNYVLTTDGSGNTSWINLAGSGTVTSVGLALPSIFAVSGSPVTGGGTLTGTLATQAKNLVWGGPSTGANAAPTFRALVGADLPVPGPATLGGIESYAAVTSQWIRSISTAGVPASSQPAFTDISGSVAATQLPNPSATTLGGVESLAAVSSKWINQISTSGVPSATQPGFSDLSGAITLAQFPTQGSSTVLGNNSGGTAIPTALTASQVLDFVGITQGNVLYRNGTVWTALAPGTNGQVLTTGGAAANPSWTTVSGTGTVTSVASGAGLTGGPITITGTLALAAIADKTVLANVSGGSLAPSSTTPTLILDVIGATEGDILYRGVSAWLALAPGTNGQVLQTQGAGATPQWANAGTVSAITAGAGLTGGTITTSGTIALSSPVALSDGGLGGSQAAATAGQIPVYPGSGGAAVPTTTVFYAAAFGVKADGSTNDVAAINAAAAAAQAAGGGVVQLSPGTSIVGGSSINLASNVCLVGQGPGATVLKLTSVFAGAIVFSGTSTSNSCVRNLTIDQNYLNYGPVAGNAAVAIYLMSVTNPVVDNVHIINQGISASVSIATSTSSITVGTGTKTFTGLTPITVGSVLSFSTGAPIYIYGASSSNYMMGTVTSYSSTTLVVNVTAIGGSGTLSSWSIGPPISFGIIDQGTTGGRISNNYFSMPYPSGFQNGAILATPFLGTVSSGLSITNNTLHGNAMELDIANSFVTGNFISGAYGGGIVTDQDGPCIANVISGNVIKGNSTVNTGGGIESWCALGTISSNIIFNNGADGIDVGGRNSIVVDNVIYDNGSLSPGTYSGIEARYDGTDYNADNSIFSNNRSFNTLGTSGPQVYGYTEQTSLLTNIQVLGNGFDTNATGNTNILSSSTTIGVSCSGSPTSSFVSTYGIVTHC